MIALFSSWTRGDASRADGAGARAARRAAQPAGAAAPDLDRVVGRPHAQLAACLERAHGELGRARVARVDPPRHSARIAFALSGRSSEA